MQPQLTIANFNLVSALGAGTFAKVYKAHSLDECDDETYAVKIQSRDSMSHKMGKQCFLNEIFVHSQMSHPRIVKYCGGDVDATMTKHSTGQTRERSYITTEYCQNGDLFHHVLSRQGLSETLCKHYFK